MTSFSNPANACAVQSEGENIDEVSIRGAVGLFRFRMEAGAALLRDGNKLKEKRVSRMVVVKVLTHRPTFLPFCRKNHIDV